MIAVLISAHANGKGRKVADMKRSPRGSTVLGLCVLVGHLRRRGSGRYQISPVASITQVISAAARED
jgi:hypothetical protein